MGSRAVLFFITCPTFYTRPRLRAPGWETFPEGWAGFRGGLSKMGEEALGNLGSVVGTKHLRKTGL